MRPRRSRGRGPVAVPPPVTLRTLAEYLGLAPATISIVINRSPVAESIPQRTRNRILAAARKLGYRPNSVARSLRHRRTFTIGVLVPEISEGYAALVMSGIEDYLLKAGYLYFVASHRHRPDLIEEYPKLLLDRAVEGVIAVDTPCPRPLPVPVVAVSGHGRTAGVTNIELDHDLAARLALEHLAGLGHRRLAFIKGQSFSSDTEVRWRAIARAARALGLPVDLGLVVQLEGDLASPELGYQVTLDLLARRRSFTALFAFNDISAIGAIRALREAGHRVPEDVSVVGFDDIQSAAYQHPPLTTVRQPLRRMGEIAADIMLRRIAAGARAAYPRSIVVEPELVVRGTTARARAGVAAMA
ncbi:MAG TPA: LacI family DNA-binding transcriptional regulator [Vicinamibacterales bacterium]|nr:LacI family DNA-binding transcriptional regulator [Vicinamibacterales bacterium]